MPFVAHLATVIALSMFRHASASMGMNPMVLIFPKDVRERRSSNVAMERVSWPCPPWRLLTSSCTSRTEPSTNALQSAVTTAHVQRMLRLTWKMLTRRWTRQGAWFGWGSLSMERSLIALLVRTCISVFPGHQVFTFPRAPWPIHRRLTRNASTIKAWSSGIFCQLMLPQLVPIIGKSIRASLCSFAAVTVCVSCRLWKY